MKIVSHLGRYLYLPAWYLKNGIMGNHGPLQTVLFITDRCNLNCRHCASSNHGGVTMKPYALIKSELEYSYNLGARFVDFEGGEPTLWRDGIYCLNDLYDLAHSIGYFSCTLTTNAQRPFAGTKADMVWVSVDGYREYHDKIRGKGAFAALDRNIRESRVPGVSINMTINRINRDSVEDTIAYAKDNPAIRSISLNFHTPFPGTEQLMLPWEERRRVIDEIIHMKRAGYPVMNSCSGLRAMKKRSLPKACWVSNFILLNGRRMKQCQGMELGICSDCGFSMSGEMYALMRLRPDTVLAGLRLRMGKTRLPGQTTA